MVARTFTWINARLGLRPLVWGALLAGLAGALCFVPLFDLLGYDFAFAIGLGAALAAVDIGHGAVVAARRTGRTLAVGRMALIAAAGALAVLALPLLLSLANALRVRNCNIAAGLTFYALLPVATALFAAPAGVLAGALAPRRGRLIAFALPAGSVLWTLLRLYFDPAVFALDPFGGYFPGPLYDEALRPPARLAWFRAANLVWIATALLVVAAVQRWRGPAPNAGRRGLAAAAAAMLLVSGILFLARGPAGFHVRKRDVLRALPHETRSTHFVLHTDPAAGQTAEDLARVHRDLEFRYDQLERILGAEPAGPITVYQFPSAASKKEVVGAGHTLYAKPWTREIFIQVDRFPASRLRHELAHVFAGAFGDPLFGVSFTVRFWGPLPVPRLASGLIEGIAEAADFGDPDGRSTLHQESRAMVADGRAPALATVVGAGFSTLSGARAYTLAGSFCRWLLDQQGAGKLRALYRSAGDFEGVYGQPLAALEGRWRAFLQTQPLEPAEKARAAERFRKPAIFGKTCARELAARVAEARGQMTSAPTQAIALLESVCRDDPHEPTFRLDLADAHVAAGDHVRALALAAEAAADETLTLPLRARASNLAAALHFYAGRPDDARREVERGLTLATDEGEERLAKARLRALADDDARATLGRVLFGDRPNRGVDPGLTVHLIDRFARRFPDEPLGAYLLGRQLAWRDPRLGLDLLERACPTGAPSALDPAFVKECVRLAAEAAFSAGDHPRSRAIYTQIRDTADSEAERLRASDWLERIAWESQQRPAP